MDNQSKEILGSWVSAVGTIASAIGSTPLQPISKELLKNLNLWGNVLQASGSALQADGQEQFNLEKLGNEVQAVGNLAVISGIVGNVEEDTGQKLEITGNWIQALGGLIALGDELEDSGESNQSLNIIGNLLQSIGNSLQAISGIYEIENNRVAHKGYKIHENVESLNVSGSWIQAVGSVVSLIGQIKEEN